MIFKLIIRQSNHSVGATLVEFAVTLPFFLLIVFGSIELILMQLRYSQLGEVLQQAGRYGIINYGVTIAPEEVTTACSNTNRQKIAEEVKKLLLANDFSNLSQNITCSIPPAGWEASEVGTDQFWIYTNSVTEPTALVLSVQARLSCYTCYLVGGIFDSIQNYTKTIQIDF